MLSMSNSSPLICRVRAELAPPALPPAPPPPADAVKSLMLRFVAPDWRKPPPLPLDFSFRRRRRNTFRSADTGVADVGRADADGGRDVADDGRTGVSSSSSSA